MPPKRGSSNLTNATTSHQAEYQANNQVQPSMMETPLSVQLAMVMVDQFNMFFQQVQTLTIIIQAIQTILVPLSTALQPN